jgi:hypothetical protein
MMNKKRLSDEEYESIVNEFNAYITTNPLAPIVYQFIDLLHETLSERRELTEILGNNFLEMSARYEKFLIKACDNLDKTGSDYKEMVNTHKQTMEMVHQVNNMKQEKLLNDLEIKEQKIESSSKARKKGGEKSKYEPYESIIITVLEEYYAATTENRFPQSVLPQDIVERIYGNNTDQTPPSLSTVKNWLSKYISSGKVSIFRR